MTHLPDREAIEEALWLDDHEGASWADATPGERAVYRGDAEQILRVLAALSAPTAEPDEAHGRDAISQALDKLDLCEPSELETPDGRDAWSRRVSGARRRLHHALGRPAADEGLIPAGEFTWNPETSEEFILRPLCLALSPALMSLPLCTVEVFVRRSLPDDAQGGRER